LSGGHQARRRRNYGRRQHELRQRRMSFDPEQVARQSLAHAEFEGDGEVHGKGRDGGMSA
jgi:hypothetical protein